MNFDETKTHYEMAGKGPNPHTIVRHLWTEEDFQNREDETVLDIFDFPFSHEKTFCDYGCGVGYTIKIAAPKCKKYYGVDISQSLLKIAARSHVFWNVELLVSDGKSVPLPDNSVDILCSEQVMQHILEDKFLGREIVTELSKEFYRVSTEDASFCIQFPKKSAYDHGVEKSFLKKLFKDCKIVEIDNWYYHVIKNVVKNNKPMWLNNGDFKERDLKYFGDKYVDYSKKQFDI